VGARPDARASWVPPQSIPSRHTSGGCRTQDVTERGNSSLSDYDDRLQETQAHEEWRKWYEKFLLMVGSGSREIFRIVE